ncbi:MAG: response regulator [Candidatus Krumholzibacteria bacterium]|nr:response regulator [Candidatus Krumholzibacteria bacterium]
MKKNSFDAISASGSGGNALPADGASLDLAAWQKIFKDTQVPLYIEDVASVRPRIKQMVAEAGDGGLRCWLDAHPQYVLQVISGVKILHANEAAVVLNAAASEHDLLVSLEKLVLPETLKAFKDLICAIAEGQSYYEGECRYRALDGREHETLNKAWIPAEDDPFQLMALATIDITDLNLAKQAQAESEERYRLLIETARDVIIRHDLSGQITFVNQAGIESLGLPRERIIGMSGHDLLSPEAKLEALKRRDARVAGDTGVFLYETEFQRSDGRVLPLEVSSTLLPGPLNGSGEPQVLLVARNIADRRKTQAEERQAEARLRDAQKFESLGVLAGGIAHDFNNLLVTIVGNAELLSEDLAGSDEHQKGLAAIMEAGDQAAELCRQMQAYAGATPSSTEAHDLSEVVGKIQHLVQAAVTGSSHVHFELAEELPPVLIDSTQIRQVIMNMVNNAAEAVGSEGGEVMIRTGVKDLTRTELKKWTAGDELSPGHHVFCEIRDSGCGMDANTVARMFEPFLSTKFAGRGLGMSAALGIVKSHGGAFMVESQPEQGTVVSFWLPAQSSGKAVSGAKEAEPVPVSYDLKGRTIMLVDDDPRVRAVAESFLRRLGCRVLSAADGYDAVRLYGQRHAEIDAIVLDYTMPGMDGGGTSRRLRVIRPDVPLLMTSGHDEAEVRANCGVADMAGFIAKPYNLRQLNEVLALALNG